jgi:hypothetical protein
MTEKGEFYMIMDQSLSLYSIAKQTEGNIVSDMNGEKVMLSIANGKYYNLGAIGGEIWDQIDSSKTISEIVSELLVNYEISQQECESHVLEFVDCLVKEGIVTIA